MINESIEAKRYDFIVVGAGAAGSILAAELSAFGAEVLRIESGGPDDAPTIINAVVWARGMQRDFNGWAKSGVKGWAFADVLPVFKAQEDWEGGANEWR